MWAIVPVKQFHLAKQRLAPGLSQGERSDLFRAMVADVLDCLQRTSGIARILVVTREAAARSLAHDAGASVLEEADSDLVAAITQAARAAAAQGASGVVIVPGDLPLIDPNDLQAVLSAHSASLRAASRRAAGVSAGGTANEAEKERADGVADGTAGGEERAVTLVSDAQGVGTNCLACTPAQIIPFRFGPTSCADHLRAAREAGVTPTLLQRPGLALDIDTPADLAEFTARGHRGHAVAFLEASGIASRLRAQAATAGAGAISPMDGA